MDAISFITEDHARFREMLDRYEELDPDDHGARRALVDELIAGLVRHAVMEEEALYPFVMGQLPDLEHAVREELEEHHVIEVLMAELQAMDPGDPQFDAKLEVLAENLLHHFNEEEEELLPRLRDEVDAATLEGLVDDLRAAHETAPTTPDPDRVGG
jgi:hemerythrin superfamily protein